MIRLLYYTSAPLDRPGGVVTWLTYLAEGLPRYNIQVIAPKAPVKELLKFPPNVEIRTYVNANKLTYSFLPSLGDLPEIMRLTKNVDIILADMAIAFNDAITLILSRFSKRRLVYVLHCPLFLPRNSLHNLYVKALTVHISKYASALWVMNSHEEFYLRKLGFRRVWRIPYMIDVRKFDASCKSRKEERFIVVFLARLTWQKGADILLKAIKRLMDFLDPDFRRDIMFRVAGYGDFAREFINLSRLRRNIEFLGAVTSSNVPNVLSSANLFVLPSRYETLGIPALEAQASGVPVVATNIQGLRDIVIDKKTGLLIRPESSEELANAILWFYDLWKNKHDVYEDFCRSARENALNYDLSVIAPKIDKMLSDVLKSGW